MGARTDKRLVAEEAVSGQPDMYQMSLFDSEIV